MSSKNTSFHKRKMKCGKLVLNFSKPLVMGILNLTPDSFYDGGRYQEENEMIRQVEQMLVDGADLIDLGAVSSRPGSESIAADEEMNRIGRPLQVLIKHFPDTIFSIDTYRSEVARACIAEGAHVINDISGGKFDANMYKTVAKLGVPYILMHLKDEPKVMQDKPIVEGVVEEVSAFFKEAVMQLKKNGVEDIILDPGFGFGKSLQCNYSLLKHLEELRISGLPIMAGVSRKSMLNKLLDICPEEALNGTTVLHTIALQNGANILRVHDVKEAVEAIRIITFYSTDRACQ